jgi:hypothetical protein
MFDVERDVYNFGHSVLTGWLVVWTEARRKD